MKKMLTIIIILAVFLPTVVFCATVQFQWNGNTEPDLAGYRLYMSPNSGSYSPADLVAELSMTENGYIQTDVYDGQWFWVLTAFDLNGNESDFSNEVSITIDTTAPSAPTGFMVYFIN
jgi:hypothetical protein